MNTLFRQATNPLQYDGATLRWEKISGPTSLVNEFLWQALDAISPSLKGKDVLDIGCGTGWLLDRIARAGARSVEGVEPSAQNVAWAKKYFPRIAVHHASFETFHSKKKYHTIFSIMSLSHVADLQSAMEKVSSLLMEDGEFIIIVPDFTYMRTPRHNYTLDIEERNSDEYVVATHRPTGPIVDVVRTNDAYGRSAARAGLEVIEERGLPPTEEVIQRDGRYERFRNQPMKDLLRFRKSKTT